MEPFEVINMQSSCNSCQNIDISPLNSVSIFFSSFSEVTIPSHGDWNYTLPLMQNNCSIQHLEHVQVEVSLQYTRRGYLEMFSTSPSGTKSKLLYSRMMDIFMGFKRLKNWRVTSLHYWGEKPFGDWNITIRNAKSRSLGNKGDNVYF